MTVQHRKRIAQNDQLAVADPLLFQRKVFRTKEALATFYRLPINSSGGASNAQRVVLDDDLGLFNLNALGFNLRESIPAFPQKRPRIVLLVQQRSGIGLKTLVAFVFKISIKLLLADEPVIPVHCSFILFLANISTVRK